MVGIRICLSNYTFDLNNQRDRHTCYSPEETFRQIVRAKSSLLNLQKLSTVQGTGNAQPAQAVSTLRELDLSAGTQIGIEGIAKSVSSTMQAFSHCNSSGLMCLRGNNSKPMSDGPPFSRKHIILASPMIGRRPSCSSEHSEPR